MDQPKHLHRRAIEILVSQSDQLVADTRAELARQNAELRATRRQIELARQLIDEFADLDQSRTRWF
jgi:hypothetical protein